MILGNMLMALLALPRALKDFCYLFEYSSHYLPGMIVYLLPSIYESMQCINVMFETYKRG
jgi:hypothetical protein